jgi:hypothetical protein
LRSPQHPDVKNSSLRATRPAAAQQRAARHSSKTAEGERDGHHSQPAPHKSDYPTLKNDPLTPQENTMTCDRDTDVQELTAEQLELVAGGSLIQEMMANLKLMGEILSNVSKTRSEISMTFARNARA